MLEYLGADKFVATCDRCAAVSALVVGTRELAITRLMLQRWHLRTNPDRTTTRACCPSCRPSTLPDLPPQT